MADAEIFRDDDGNTNRGVHESEWANGITLKRTARGYSWSIAVRAESADIDDLYTAIETATTIDRELAKRYPGVRVRGVKSEA